MVLHRMLKRLTLRVRKQSSALRKRGFQIFYKELFRVYKASTHRTPQGFYTPPNDDTLNSKP